MTNKGGRPKKEVNWQQVDQMCALHCTGEEQASILGMSYEALNYKCKEAHGIGFLDYFKQKSANGRMSLRRRQYTAAMDGNTTMLVWLGKNWLGQRDVADDSARDIPPINITLTNAPDSSAD